MILREKALRLMLQTARAHSTPSVDSNEVYRFGRLSNQWFAEQGPFKALHSLNKLRIPLILKNLPKSDTPISAVDIGCGGGLLSVPLSKVGLHVTGIDATAEAIDAAREWLKTPSSTRTLANCSVGYEHSTAEDFAAQHKERFDVVVASEIVEHVASVESFVSACAALAKPGGTLIFTTINKTLLSRIAAVYLAENVLRIVPEGMHEWDKFVPPEDLTRLLHDNGCRVRLVNGFTYNPVCNEWHWVNSTQVNYALIAQKSR